MSDIVGGLRRRLIKDNFYYMIYNALNDLHWFDSSLTSEPVTLLSEQIDASTEIKPNKVVISSEDMSSREWEMGSSLDEYRWDTYFDIFAEDESIGIHLSGDIYDILKGKMNTIGRSTTHFDVLDLRQNDEPFLFTCEIENVDIGRVREWNRSFNKYWWVVGCTLVDHYYGEGD